MSKTTKRKYVVKEIKEDLTIPSDSQSIVKVLESRGNNLHEIMSAAGERYLASMPSKFRRNIWIKKGNFVLVEPIEEGDKVKAEIVKILTKEHIKWYRTQKVWPQEFEDESKCNRTNEEPEDVENELFINTNRQPMNNNITNSETDTSSDESDVN